MPKALIVYFSKYGTTKEYAELIAKELAGDIYSVKNFNQNILRNYDTIIIGSGLYAGKMKGLNIFIKYFEVLKNKKLVLFTCGLADYSKIENKNAIYKRIKNELPEEMEKNIKIFYLRGGINYAELTLKHKIMMWMLKMQTMKQKNGKMNEENNEFIKTYGKKLNFVDKKNIIELLEYSK